MYKNWSSSIIIVVGMSHIHILQIILLIVRAVYKAKSLINVKRYKPI